MKKIAMHPSFKLNDNAFQTKEALLKYVKSEVPVLNSFLEDWFNSSECITVQTSGSTGKPKQIQLLKEHMINSAKATGSYFNCQENTTALLCMNVDYIAGKMMVIRAMVLGWSLDVISPVSNPLDATSKSYDFSALVPLQLENSLEKINTIKTLIVGGGVVSESLQKQIQKCNTRIFATYGMTETITHIAVKPLNHIKKRPSFYHVLPDVEIAIDNRNCLVIDAPKLSNEVVVTNDVIQLVSENEFEWLGRYDNVINSGGIKLHPEKIEKKFSEIIETRFFVASEKDDYLGERLILIVESDVLNEEKILNQLKAFSKIERFEVPKKIYTLSKFIETETKKIQRSKTLDLIYIK